MDLLKLKEKLISAKLHPIFVKGSAFENDEDGLSFDGLLEEYFDAVHALSISAVFVSTGMFGEDWFSYTPAEESESIDEDSEGINLCAIRPALEKFRAHIDQIAVVRLSARMPVGNLNFSINEDWWLKFVEVWREAIETINDDQAAAQAASVVAQEKRDREVLAALDKLIHDEKFVHLPTQRAMLMYAREDSRARRCK